jgi:TPR repeat protein
MDLLNLAGYGSLQSLIDAAREGDAGAQFNLGVMYAEGRDVPQNLIEAARWYAAAADAGDAQAQFNLGLMFYHGNDLPQDLSAAFELFCLAAAQGDDRARQGMAAILAESPPEAVPALRALAQARGLNLN